ncbi:hypothetical protein IGI04_018821 [Brassica rapa subsp. trilocularis]|uniref:DUF223 domain-containing protein n=2 Tax=Brassica campestris TaxID=3711 RepID=A0ABQ7ME17_BRACM|nr:hypothetical protein IGI04_018821 [Brassica rapa subsp. trilocularis]
MRALIRNIANSKNFLFDLKSDKCSSRVQVRLLRFWEARYVRPSGELMSVHMFLPDSKATIMPATVNASHFSRFMVRVQLSPPSRRLRRLMGSRLWEGGELLDIILSRGGKYKEEDAKFVMVQDIVSDCILSSPKCCTPISQTPRLQ